ncbi:PadR family transcriptional regulator [Methanomassiliicoccus luminyensis]|uniref:PadR family transcriptional regulator n=1 Tax=Methanomassiliicoccus luminyensis TaxID=1080712 RepID=UPI00037C9A91|nr:PadR family transcriptional regulator [Methanomassiliicoccus luminyensis]
MISWDDAQDDLRKAFGTQTFRAGFLKLSILRILSERPLHGYALIREIERITGSGWKPSPGSVYPALQSLQDNGLIHLSVDGRQRVYHITPLGNDMLMQAIQQVQAGLQNIQNILSYKYEDADGKKGR